MKSSWEKIVSSKIAKQSIDKVKVCEQNCWMVTTARTAMRSPVHHSLPKNTASYWVILNKLKRLIKKDINFNRYIDYSNILPNVISSSIQLQKSENEIKRKSFLTEKIKKKVQTKEDIHYNQGEYFNL